MREYLVDEPIDVLVSHTLRRRTEGMPETSNVQSVTAKLYLPLVELMDTAVDFGYWPTRTALMHEFLIRGLRQYLEKMAMIDRNAAVQLLEEVRARIDRRGEETEGRYFWTLPDPPEIEDYQP